MPPYQIAFMYYIGTALTNTGFQNRHNSLDELAVGRKGFGTCITFSVTCVFRVLGSLIILLLYRKRKRKKKGHQLPHPS